MAVITEFPFLGVLDRFAGVKRFAGPVDEKKVTAFECEYGLALPPDYRAFVRRFGCGHLGAVELYGLGVPATGVPHIGFILRRLAELKTPLPDGVIPVAEGPDGVYLCLNTRSGGVWPVGAVFSCVPGESFPERPALVSASYGDFVLSALASLSL